MLRGWIAVLSFVPFYALFAIEITLTIFCNFFSAKNAAG
jgi:hypothetical protein